MNKPDPFDKEFSIRKHVLNLTMAQWAVSDTLDRSAITPRQWIAAMGGKGGFLTARLDDHEQEFVNTIYANAIAMAPPPQRPACEKDVPGG